MSWRAIALAAALAAAAPTNAQAASPTAVARATVVGLSTPDGLRTAFGYRGEVVTAGASVPEDASTIDAAGRALELGDGSTTGDVVAYDGTSGGASIVAGRPVGGGRAYLLRSPVGYARDKVVSVRVTAVRGDVVRIDHATRRTDLGAPVVDRDGRLLGVVTRAGSAGTTRLAAPAAVDRALDEADDAGSSTVVLVGGAVAIAALVALGLALVAFRRARSRRPDALLDELSPPDPRPIEPTAAHPFAPAPVDARPRPRPRPRAGEDDFEVVLRGTGERGR